MKFSIIVAFKNREYQRCKNFFDTLLWQTKKDFEVIFVNQGSDNNINDWIEKLTLEYSFINYCHTHTQGFLWNKGNALNIGIKAAKGEYIFVADIDLLLLPDYLASIDQLLSPSTFITHNVYYIPESFPLKNITDISTSKHNDLFHEAFHSACIIKRDVLVEIRGYDEFYLVWGVEDDDIIRSLERKGQRRKHITANEINIYHQWHPSVSPGRPRPWYLVMVNHLFSVKRNDEFGLQWGRVRSIDDRPVLKIIQDKNYKDCVKLEFWSNHTLLFFNPFISAFNQLTFGEVAYLEYTHISKEVKKKVSFLFTQKYKASEHTEERITDKDISEFFHFFIGCSRLALQDYFYRQEGNNFLFVCIKG